MNTYTDYSLRIGRVQFNWTMRDRTPEERLAAKAEAERLDRKLLLVGALFVSLLVVLPVVVSVVLLALDVQ